MENTFVKFIVALIYFILTFVAPPLAGGGPYAEGAAAKFECELLFNNSPERGAADELIVGINRTERTLYVLAHGGEDGSFWVASSARPVVDTLIDGLVNNGSIKANDVKVIVLICCYPGCQQITTAAIGIPIIPFADVKVSIKTLVTEGQIVAVY